MSQRKQALIPAQSSFARTADVAAPAVAATTLSRDASLAARLERLAPRILTVVILAWIAVMFVTSYYKYETYGQGYDQVDFEQAIWNALYGRPMEDFRFGFTWSVFGMDWMPMLMLFVPFYWLIPSPHTLFFLQVVGTALGAVPVYWLARDRLGSKLAGLCLGVAFLLYPVIEHGVLNPFQVRLFATTLLIFAFYYFEKGNWKLFWAAALLALIARTDVAFVVAMFGIYGLLTRRKWQFVWLPLIVGMGYFALSSFVIVPSFAYAGALTPGTGPVQDAMACWPCGVSPQIAYYAHLGSSGPGIVAYIVTHPIEVAQLAFTPEKLSYLLALVLPLALLPLLGPKQLVLSLPIVALNLLATREAQFSVEHHYSLLVVPGVIAAAVFGAGNLRDIVARSRVRASSGATHQLPYRWLAAGGATLVVWALLMQIPYKNPVARAYLYRTPPEVVAAANELVKMVPQEAKVATTSFQSPHLLPRRFIFNFPPAPYSPYKFGPRQSFSYGPPFYELDYILVDPKASALREPLNMINGKTALELLEQMPDWELVAEKQGLRLYRHKSQ